MLTKKTEAPTKSPAPYKTAGTLTGNVTIPAINELTFMKIAVLAAIIVNAKNKICWVDKMFQTILFVLSPSLTQFHTNKLIVSLP